MSAHCTQNFHMHNTPTTDTNTQGTNKQETNNTNHTHCLFYGKLIFGLLPFSCTQQHTDTGDARSSACGRHFRVVLWHCACVSCVLVFCLTGDKRQAHGLENMIRVYSLLAVNLKYVPYSVCVCLLDHDIHAYLLSVIN